jgi:thermitase
LPASLKRYAVRVLTGVTLLSGVLIGTSVEYRARNENPQPIESYGSNLVMSERESPIIAILDSGIDKKHRDIVGHVKYEVNFSDSPTVDDVFGHGTHVAGIILGKSYAIGGVKSTDDFRSYCNSENFILLNVKVLNDGGRANDKQLSEGIRWAADHGADIINISVIGPQYQELKDAVDYAWDRGAVLVASAGRATNPELSYPGAYSNCIAVAAENSNGFLLPCSNRADWFAKAPGVNICSTLPGNNYGIQSGESMAVAYISNKVAELYKTAIDLNGNGYVNDEIMESIRALY